MRDIIAGRARRAANTIWEFISWKSSQLKQECPLIHQTTNNQGGEGMLKRRKCVQSQQGDKRVLSRWNVGRESALPGERSARSRATGAR